MCTVLLPPGGNTTAVKYITSYHTISYHIISYHIISYIIYHVIYRTISYIILYHTSYHIICHTTYIVSYHISSYKQCLNRQAQCSLCSPLSIQHWNLSINTFQIFHENLSSNYRRLNEEKQKNKRKKLICVFSVCLLPPCHTVHYI